MYFEYLCKLRHIIQSKQLVISLITIIDVHLIQTLLRKMYTKKNFMFKINKM